MAKRRGKYRSTPKRRAALKKAQAVSARKRKAAPNKRSPVVSSRRSGYSMSPTAKRRLAIGASGVAVTAITAGGIVARHKLSGSSFSKTPMPVVTHLGNIHGTITKRSLVSQRMTDKSGSTRSRTVSVIGKKQGPLGSQFKYSYDHQPLKLEHVLGKNIRNRILASQHFENPFVPRYVPQRGQSDTPDPKNPGFNKKGQLLATKGNWGSSGKRMPISGPRKYVGKYEIFSNLAADYPKKKISGFTTIGSVYAYKRTK